MSTPVVTLRTVESVSRIQAILNDETRAHNGFPVVEDYDPDSALAVCVLCCFNTPASLFIVAVYPCFRTSKPRTDDLKDSFSRRNYWSCSNLT